MPLLFDIERPGSTSEVRAPNCVTVGLINNMPDAALKSTERQFVDLMRESTHSTVVRLMLFSIPEVPRSDAALRDMAGRYRDVSELWDTRLDGLIVTGTEPRSRDLKDEPYWNALGQVIDWAREHTASTIWSCLAAHAAVLRVDGIERQLLPEKCSGVFGCEAIEQHAMTRGVAMPMRIPHSRLNDLPERALKSCGYRILTRSPVVGVDMFVKQERSFNVFLQGHPEYETDSLLREYRRDIDRYLRGEREHYPAAPQGYLDEESVAWANAFRHRALADRDGELIKAFPIRELEARLNGNWRRAAAAIYENWFDYLKERKAERQSPMAPRRRAWRDRRSRRPRPTVVS
ncbi:MAG: homoserine O-succinyltransferase [Xanthobacteraceae bacterium]